MERLQNIKIIFIDIDGTLCNRYGLITLRTKRAIKKITKKGIKVIITSGRNCRYCIETSIKANASNIVISSNGAEIYDYKNNNILYSDEILFDKIEKIWDFCYQNQIGLIINSGLDRYVNNYVKKIKPTDIKISDIKKLKNKKISQLIGVTTEYNNLSNLIEYSKCLDLKLSNFSRSFLEKRENSTFRVDIVNKKVSKGTGITKLLKIMDIKKENSLCFGDYVNDVEMFKACGYKIAMGNSCQELIEKADYVTLTNNDNGIAYFLNKYL